MRSTGQEKKKDKKLPLRDNSCNGYFAFYRRGGGGESLECLIQNEQTD